MPTKRMVVLVPSDMTWIVSPSVTRVTLYWAADIEYGTTAIRANRDIRNDFE
jgi:hypothetical protein